jgi:hydroxypyruvate isomerase
MKPSTSALRHVESSIMPDTDKQYGKPKVVSRRGFLASVAASAVACSLTDGSAATVAGTPAIDKKGLSLSAIWSTLGKVSIPDGMSLLSRHGYDGFELPEWRNPETLEAFVKERDKYPLECFCIMANKGPATPGCGLVVPAERDGFVAQVKLAIAAAKKLNSKGLLVLSGNEMEGVTRAEQLGNAVYALRAAAPILEDNGITAWIEVVNNVDYPGYLLHNIRDTAVVVDRVYSPNVKILCDLYHVQMMEGNLINNIQLYKDRIGHFHVADLPGRHEPGTGEVNYRNVFKAIHELCGVSGLSVGLEYRPLAPIEDNLIEMRKLATFD